MNPSFLAKTNYLNCYSLKLLIVNILLTLPTLCVAMMILIWGKLDFILILPVSLSIGLALVLPATYTIPRPSKERVAIDALVGGVAMMVILCFLLLPLKITPFKEEEPFLRDQSLLMTKETIDQCDLTELDSEAEHLEHPPSFTIEKERWEKKND